MVERGGGGASNAADRDAMPVLPAAVGKLQAALTSLHLLYEEPLTHERPRAVDGTGTENRHIPGVAQRSFHRSVVVGR